MRRQPETAGAALVCSAQLPEPGTRRRNSSKKFNSNVGCVIGFGQFQPREALRVAANAVVEAGGVESNRGIENTQVTDSLRPL